LSIQNKYGIDEYTMQNSSKNMFDINAGQIMKEMFAMHLSKDFVFDGLVNRTRTYAEFLADTLHTRDALLEKKVQKGGIVCLFMENSLELMFCYFACLLIGAVVVPLDPKKGTKELQSILDQFTCSLMITDQEYGLTLTNAVTSKDITRNIGKVRAIFRGDLDLFDNIDQHALFLMSFTSGSTGVPKGVRNSLYNLITTAIALQSRFHFNEQHRFYHNLPMTYMAGILNLIIVPFIAGSKIIIGERFSASNALHFWDLPVRYGANAFWFIPAVVSLLLEFDRGNLGINYTKKTQIVGLCATAPLDAQKKYAFERKYSGITLYESYGLSETLFVASNYPELSQKKHSVGQLLPGTAVSFADDGEILIEVPWMFQGYSNGDAQKEFAGNAFRSGDIGIIDEDGSLHITGRKKDLIIRGGINISPRMLEDWLSDGGLFKEASVLGFPDQYLGEKTVCFYATNTDNTIDLNALRNTALHELGNAYHIDEFVKIEVLPRNTNGKIDKFALRDLYITL